MSDPIIRVVEDGAQVEGGHAVVIVEGQGDYRGDGSLGIRRLGYEAAHLAETGWRVPEARVLADRYELRDGALHLYLGPEVTEFLTPDDHVEIDVNGVGGSRVLSWPAITPHYGGKAQGRRLGARSATSASPSPPPPPPVPPEPAPVPLAPQAAPPAVEAVRPERMVDVPTERPASRFWLVALVLAVLVGVGAVAVYRYVVAPRPGPQAAAPAPVAGAPPATPATPAAPATEGQRSVQDIVRAAANPGEIYDEAQKFKARGDVQGMLLLLENAAEQGHARAMMDIARLYDPATFEAGKPFSHANPGQAAKFYRKAEAAGAAEAKPALDALHILLQKAAEGGDAEAKAALATYWPESGQ